MRVILKLELIVKVEYNTHQKKLLIDFLKLNCDTAYTIEEIAAAIPVGKSTIYRLMTKLIENGIVKRFSGDTGRIFLYQYISCEHCSAHLHMKCTDCGKIFHMDVGASDTLLSDIEQGNNFSVDRSRTILLGKCAHCSKPHTK
ncbi:MAG: transcriptional repressor [Clostridia bacterium]|nr:transcriptional repressor [Clostridia bacterium]